jgi:hypothetical protein
MAAPGGRGRGRREGGASCPEPTITCPGTFGPDEYEPPLPQFPLSHRDEFVDGTELRPYDNRRDD